MPLMAANRVGSVRLSQAGNLLRCQMNLECGHGVVDMMRLGRNGSFLDRTFLRTLFHEFCGYVTNSTKTY
jgi:hypothetical protein